MRYAQLVMGPAGSGKSTYCGNLLLHAKDAKRSMNVVNLDPAAEEFSYDVLIDIRDLVQVQDVMEDEVLHFGPNGGLVYCMEYLLKNCDWLKEELEEGDDDYILFDCPGQIELYTHMIVMRQLVELLQLWNFNVCGVFLLDSHFMVEPSKFMSGTLAALSVMINMEIPHVNVLSKIDLLSNESKKQIESYLAADTNILEDEENKSWGVKYAKLSKAIAKIIDDYSLVKFYPLDISDEESIPELLAVIDNTIQFGEDADVTVRDFDELEQDGGFYDG